jgi:hypothetical protein
MEKQKNKNKNVLVGGFLSLILLGIFFILKYYDFKGLELDIKWIAVCGVPLLISIFISGYIKSVKAFGVELEAHLEKSIDIKFVKSLPTIETYGFKKESLQFLDIVEERDKRKAIKLSFISGKKNYYEQHAVEQYIRQLKNLQFFEITSEQGSFEFLIDARSFIRRSREDVRDFDVLHRKVSSLISAIENNDILVEFPQAISTRVKRTDSIIDAYKQFESDTQRPRLQNDNQVLPVVDDSEKMIGLIDRRTIEEKISKAVLKSLKK